jgi:hypothetical protein
MKPFLVSKALCPDDDDDDDDDDDLELIKCTIVQTPHLFNSLVKCLIVQSSCLLLYVVVLLFCLK